MRVYIQGKKVRTTRLANGLYKPHMYRYSSARFKTRSEHEAKRAQDDSKIGRQYNALLVTSTKEVMFLPDFVCLFVCLSVCLFVCLCVSKIT